MISSSLAALILMMTSESANNNCPKLVEHGFKIDGNAVKSNVACGSP